MIGVSIYIRKDIQVEDNNANEMVSNVYLLLVQIIVWLEITWKVQTERNDFEVLSMGKGQATTWLPKDLASVKKREYLHRVLHE